MILMIRMIMTIGSQIVLMERSAVKRLMLAAIGIDNNLLLVYYNKS